MDSRQINEILKGLLGPHFLGTYARNGMPTCVVPPFSLVCNTDPNTETGEHWIAVHVDEEGNGEYFDSYGLPPLHDAFENFLNRHCKTWTWNDRQIQQLASTVCGQHCIFYLTHRYLGLSLQEIRSFFTEDFRDNDRIVESYVKELWR